MMQQKRDKSRVATALLVIVGLLISQAMHMVPVYRESLQTYLAIGDGRFGFILSLLGGGGMVTVLAGGAAVDHFGPAPITRICFFGIASSMLLMAIGGPHWQWVAAAVTVFSAAILPLLAASNALLVDLFPSRTRQVLYWNLAGSGVGAFFFPPSPRCSCGGRLAAHPSPLRRFSMVRTYFFRDQSWP